MIRHFAALLGLALAALAADLYPAGSAANAASKRPTTIVRCIPPGSTKPMPCGSLSAGSTIELRTEKGLAQAPTAIYFREVSAAGRPRAARADLQIKWFIDHARLNAVVPKALCAGAAKGQQLQFEIQVATSDMNQAQSAGDADSIGYFQMRC